MVTRSPYSASFAARRSAVFATLRATLASEVSSSAVLADLLEKLNAMQGSQESPDAFRPLFEAFLARAEDNMDVVRPYLPALAEFLEPAAEVADAEEDLDWAPEVA
jgi:hypothetical protein